MRTSAPVALISASAWGIGSSDSIGVSGGTIVQGLMPTFNLALRHRVIRCTAEVVDVFVIELKPSVLLRVILITQ